VLNIGTAKLISILLGFQVIAQAALIQLSTAVAARRTHAVFDEAEKGRVGVSDFRCCNEQKRDVFLVHENTNYEER